MYGGRPGYGGELPYGIGERSSAAYNLAEVSEAGYGPYLGNLFDDITKIASKVGVVSGELSKVASGKATVATVPTGYASLTIPMGSSPVSQAIPLWVVGASAAALLYLAFRRR
jgi:hypothetical protein